MNKLESGFGQNDAIPQSIDWKITRNIEETKGAVNETLINKDEIRAAEKKYNAEQPSSDTILKDAEYYAWNRTPKFLSEKTKQSLNDSFEADKILAKITQQTQEQFRTQNEETLLAQMAAAEAQDSYIG